MRFFRISSRTGITLYPEAFSSPMVRGRSSVVTRGYSSFHRPSGRSGWPMERVAAFAPTAAPRRFRTGGAFGPLLWSIIGWPETVSTEPVKERVGQRRRGLAGEERVARVLFQGPQFLGCVGGAKAVETGIDKP